MCNCIKEIKKRIQTEMPQKNKQYANLEITSVVCDNEALMLEPKTYTCLSIPFTAYHQPLGRKKKTEVNMVAKFCPFCGERYIDEEN